MEAEILKVAASQGLWAVLFVALLFYVLKHNEKRECRPAPGEAVVRGAIPDCLRINCSIIGGDRQSKFIPGGWEYQ